VIHNLSMWTARDKSLTFDQLKAEATKAQKDLHLVVLLYSCISSPHLSLIITECSATDILMQDF